MNYNAQLLEAAQAEKEDHEKVLRLIQSGADVNTKDGYTPLHWAACRGHYEIAKTLLEHGARINDKSNYNKTPLTYAIDKNNERVVLLLLEKGADPNVKVGNNGFALEYAITQNKNAVIVELLIEHGANVNGVPGKKTPLHWACEKEDKKLVQLLLHRGAGLEAKDANNQKPVDIAKKKNFHEIVEILEKKFPLWLRLYLASKQGNYEECKELLEQGVLVESSQGGLYCPLAAASKKGHSQIVQLLLEKGARMNYYQDGNTKNPLYLASKQGHKEIVSLLLVAGGNRDLVVNGESLLHVAVRNNHEETVRLLIEKEANPNFKDDEGCTPLHHAALNGKLAIVTCLLNAINVNVANNKMETPLQLACQGNHRNIIQLLLEKGATKEALNVQKQNYEDSDSDATVDYKNIQADFSRRILNNADVVELTDKLVQLTSLISQLNDSAIKVELIQSDLVYEAEYLKHLNRKVDQATVLKGFKLTNSNGEVTFEDNYVLELSDKMDESRKKETELRAEVQKLQTEIPQLKTTVKSVYREIRRFIDKIKVSL